jgi:hypothetical protein
MSWEARVATARPPLRPGLNFHFCTAWTAGTSNSRWEERMTRVSITSPLELMMNSTATSPLMPARLIS